jgi:hypothetical protein
MPESSATPVEVDSDISAIRAELDAVRNQQVEEWLRLVRFGSVIPRSVETSLSWRITRPIRLAQTAVGVLRRDGAHRFWATTVSRLRRMVARR